MAAAHTRLTLVCYTCMAATDTMSLWCAIATYHFASRTIVGHTYRVNKEDTTETHIATLVWLLHLVHTE